MSASSSRRQRPKREPGSRSAHSSEVIRYSRAVVPERSAGVHIGQRGDDFVEKAFFVLALEQQVRKRADVALGVAESLERQDIIAYPVQVDPDRFVAPVEEHAVVELHCPGAHAEEQRERLPVKGRGGIGNVGCGDETAFDPAEHWNFLLDWFRTLLFIIAGSGLKHKSGTVILLLESSPFEKRRSRMGPVGRELGLEHLSREGFLRLVDFVLEQIPPARVHAGRRMPPPPSGVPVELYAYPVFDVPLTGGKHLRCGDGDGVAELELRPGEVLFSEPFAWKLRCGTGRTELLLPRFPAGVHPDHLR